MSKPARGSKRVCQSCGARFYDLGRTPIVCPSCQAVYQVTQPTSRRGERAPAPEVREKVEPEVETVALEPETMSLEEVEEAGVGPSGARLDGFTLSPLGRGWSAQPTG